MMKKFYTTFMLIAFSVALTGCWMYSFTGGNTGDAKTIQINLFPNQASMVEPTLSRKFTNGLRDLFTKQTNLTLVKNDGDLLFEGEIVDYQITPTSVTSDQLAAQNRLTIRVNVRYTNRLVDKDSFEREFSFYSDYGASELLEGNVLNKALKEILDRIHQDIFNASVVKW